MNKDKLAYIAIGVITDYLVFKPVRNITPFVSFIIGITIGIIGCGTAIFYFI